MKTKSLLAVTSIGLNLVLFGALAYSMKVNDRSDKAAAPVFRIHYLPEVVLSHGGSSHVVLASSVK